MQDQLQKAINLVKKTGDKLIVFDSAKPDNVFVVLSLKDYENLVLGKSEVRGLTEDELLDKINRDIAIWKNQQEYKENLANQSELLDELAKPRSNIDRVDFSAKNITDLNNDDNYRPKKVGAGWPIPVQRKQNAEEVIEEDRQYLEEINF